MSSKSNQDPLITSPSDSYPVLDLEEDLTFLNSMRKIFHLSLFPILGALLHPAYIVVNTILLGQQESDSELLQGAFGLGSLTVGIFLLAISVSFDMSLDTLIPHAFGQRDFKMCGVYLNRQIFLMVILQTSLTIPLIWVEKIYIMFGQDEKLAEQAAIYVTWMLPSTMFHQMQYCYARWCYAQRETLIPMYATFASTFTHLTLSFLLLQILQNPMTAIAISSSAQFCVRFLVIKTLVTINPRFALTQSPFFSKDTFQNLWPQIKLSLQSLSFSVWGWWAFDVFTLIASYMSQEAVAAQTVLRSITLLMFMIPVGIYSASMALVGNNIGAEDLFKSKYYARMSLTAGLIWSVLSVSVLFLFQDFIIDIFTNSSKVAMLIKDVYYLIAIFVFFDCLQCVASAIIVSLGKQGLASVITCVGYWAFGIPISLVAVFKLDWGMEGLWFGPTYAIVFNFAFYLAFLQNSDWGKVIEEVRMRRIREMMESVGENE